MGNPYSTVSVSSGYNADPPSDDGAQTSANQLNWAKHKEKLADPLKTAIEAINANAVTAFGKIFGQGINSRAANYTLAASDQGNFIPFTAAATFTLLPAATAGEGFAVAALNISTGIVTVDGDSSETINGLTSIILGPGESMILTSDGSSWSAVIVRQFLNRVQSKSANYTLVASDDRSLVEFTAAATLTLLAVATAGAGYQVAILNTHTEALTVDGNSSETINGATTLTLEPGASAILTTDGSAWYALVTPIKDDQIKYKTAFQSISSSTTLTDDDEMTGFTLEAGAYYEFEAVLPTNYTGGVGLVVQLNFSNAAQLAFAWIEGTKGSVADEDSDRTTTALTHTNASDFSGVIVFKGGFHANATTGGTVDFQFAQAVSNAASTTIHEGAYLRIRKIS